MNRVGSTVLQSILLTILWMGFVFTGNAFNEGEPPKAIVIGLRLFEHWGYAVATLALGPVVVAYFFLYKANAPSPSNLPPS